jgi:hypothetical protein
MYDHKNGIWNRGLPNAKENGKEKGKKEEKKGI